MQCALPTSFIYFLFFFVSLSLTASCQNSLKTRIKLHKIAHKMSKNLFAWMGGEAGKRGGIREFGGRGPWLLGDRRPWLHCMKVVKLWVRRVKSNLCASLSARNTLDCDQSDYSFRIFCYISIVFGSTGNSAIRFADSENLTLELNMKCIGWRVAEIWPFEIFQMRGRSLVRRWYLHWCHILFACCSKTYGT